MSYLACVIVGIIGYIVAHFVPKPILPLRTTREAIAKALVLCGTWTRYVLLVMLEFRRREANITNWLVRSSRTRTLSRTTRCGRL